MKTTCLFLILFASLACSAQDVLITKDADTIECRIVNITEDLIYFKVQERDNQSKVPISALHKYLFRYQWETVGALNPSVFEKKQVSLQKEFTGNVRTAGFHIEKAAKYQMATPLLTLGSVAFSVGGGLQLTSSTGANRALVVTGCLLGAAAITTQIISAHHLRKAGVEFQFVPIQEPLNNDVNSIRK